MRTNSGPLFFRNKIMYYNENLLFNTKGVLK
nr:MAG TPA: hypothetical protein [Caudoviricetes sp.]